MIHITKGDIFNPTFELKECDGSYMDLSSCTVKFILKKTSEDYDSDALLSSEYVNPDTSILQFEFLSDETKNIPEGEAIAALKIYRENGKNKEVWQDSCLIKKGVFDE